MKRAFLIALLCLTTALAVAVPRTAWTPKNEWRVTLQKSTKLGRGIFQFGRPALDGDLVYAGSATSGVYAVTQSGGDKRWHSSTEGPVYAPVLVEAGQVYAVDAKGFAYAFTAADGAEVWRTELGVELVARPVVHKKLVYVVSQRGELIALQRDSGQLYWRTPARLVSSMFTVKGASDPLVLGKLLIIGYADGRVVAHKLRDGDVAWEQRVAPRNAVLHDVDTTIIPYKKRFLVASVEGGLSLRNPKHGLPVWRSKVASPNDLVVDGDRAYVTGRSAVFAVDLTTGRTLWQRAIDDGELNAPIMSAGRVVVSSTTNALYVLDADSGAIVGQRYLSGGTYGDFAARGDQLFVLTNPNRLQALRMPAGESEK